MGGLFTNQKFAGFGPCRLSQPGVPPAPFQICGSRPSILRAGVRQACPKHAGVYGMLDARGVLIYVGKAKSLRARLLSYFRQRSRDPKAGRILRDTRAIIWERAPNEFAALLRELELIGRWRPRCNVQGQPHRRRQTYLCLGRQPAPYVFPSQRPPGTASAFFGPVPAGEKTREAVRRLNDWFQLRDCSQVQEMRFADQTELFPVTRAAGCLRYEIGTCLGPCIGAVSRGTYQERVRAVRAFLGGTDREPLDSLERQMQAASTALEFERAAAARDKLEALQWLYDHLERLRQARECHSFVYPVAGPEGNDIWYLIRQGQVVSVVAAPRNGAHDIEAAAAVEAVFQGKQSAKRGKREEVDTVLLVAGWFRRYPEERGRTLEPTQALARCREPVLAN